MLEESIKTIHTGEIVKGTVIGVKEDQIILNPNLEQNWGYSGETGDGPYDSSFE